MNELTISLQTMTSLEVADLVKSEHGKVRQSIERLAKRGVIQLPPMGKVENKQSLSPNNKASVYIFTGEQGKRDSLVVVAQLSPEFTGRLVDRWQELEAQASKPALPDFTNPAEAARAWASEYEQKVIAEQKVIVMQPKADFHDRVTQSDDLLTVREAAKILRTGERRLFGFLKREGLLMASNLPYQQFMDRGLFRLVETPWTDQFNRQRISVKTCITQKGMVFIQGLQDKLALYQESAA